MLADLPLVRKIVPELISVGATDTDGACRLMEQHDRLSARDALHAAICLEKGEGVLCSYDRDFDAVEGLTRAVPEEGGQVG